MADSENGCPPERDVKVRFENKCPVSSQFLILKCAQNNGVS